MALEPFGIKPDINLNVMKHGQSLSSLTSSLLTQIENYKKTHSPRLVIGHGDTTTCFTSALSCFYHRIPFFHVEAGLRSHIVDTPFPEEFNRRSISTLSKHHFAPTEVEFANLVDEGVNPSDITVVGSTVHDAIRIIKRKAPSLPSPPQTNEACRQKIVVITLHRREVLSKLESILYSIRKTAESKTDILFICPVHPNPVVQAAFKNQLSELKNVQLTPPLDYASFIDLLTHSHLILTDSGGVQEEASFLAKRTLVVRKISERTDGLKNGIVSVVGIDPDEIFLSLNRLLTSHLTPFNPVTQDRLSSELIADYVEKAFP